MVYNKLVTSYNRLQIQYNEMWRKIWTSLTSNQMMKSIKLFFIFLVETMTKA